MRNSVSLVVIAAMTLSSCGGGGGGGSTSAVAVGGTPSPTTTSAGCSLSERQAFAKATLDEWYLFPETLTSNPSPASFTNVPDYLDALTANARALGKDRYFTYLTSIAGENAYYASGSSAGFGIRVSSDVAAKRVFIMEAFEGAPALTAGIDRGDEILSIGTTTSDLRAVADIITAEGANGVTNALGPTTAGTVRVLRVSGPSGVRTLSVTKADYDLTPLSSRYGAKILTAGGRQIGYINLRTFITSADNQLRTAIGNFRAAGVTQMIVDLRYNGGGLVSTADVFGDLLGGARSTNDIFERTTFRPEKASNNSQHNFAPTAQSVSPMRIAFIGTGATASASELVINGMAPFFGTNEALVGANTYGKPVGQIAVDKTACDDRIRVIAFATRNGAGNGEYFNGLASTLPVTCAAGDDFTRPLGDPNEASIKQAIDWLGGAACTPIATGARGASLAAADPTLRPVMLSASNPTVAQRDVPGLF